MKPHRFDPFSFLLGAVLLVFAVTYLVNGDGQTVSGRRLWPATFILVGITLAAWGLTTSLRRDRAPLPPETAVLPAVMDDGSASGDQPASEDSPAADA